ncbi:hypothetical protein AGOR_G00156280 [Albula goreensis]|uniref:Uncharacterized protein n=1 Tax=Albula goreensis TaxID=1534307 RepID=A0A8T3D4Q2_9TELE|nr:hypothetical protein AGOR_G00156280 [Albula goreensis]
MESWERLGGFERCHMAQTKQRHVAIQYHHSCGGHRACCFPRPVRRSAGPKIVVSDSDCFMMGCLKFEVGGACFGEGGGFGLGEGRLCFFKERMVNVPHMVLLAEQEWDLAAIERPSQCLGAMWRPGA